MSGCADPAEPQTPERARYDVRGPILVEAQRLEAEGHPSRKLNIGSTAPFGFEAPEAIVADMVHHLPDSRGYSDSQGIYSAGPRSLSVLPGATGCARCWSTTCSSATASPS